MILAPDGRVPIFDGFCGAGLVYDGLYEAGFWPVGMDIKPQPRYPGLFIRGDIFEQDDRFFRQFPALWFSPPCLKDTELHESARREQRAHGVVETKHPDLITPTQKLVDRLKLPYVIENVEGCQILRDPVILCGSMFDLGVFDADRWFQLQRHRKIETNWGFRPEAPCTHTEPVVGIYGGHARNRSAAFGGRGTQDVWERGHIGTMHEAMGLQRRLKGKEIDQGIPPAYSCHVGRHLLAHLRRAA